LLERPARWGPDIVEELASSSTDETREDSDEVGLALSATMSSLRRARSAAVDAALGAGLSRLRADEVGLATDELCLALVDDLASGGRLLLLVTKGRHLLRISGCSVGAVRAAPSLDPLQASIVGGLFPRYSLEIGAQGPRFSIAVARPSARSSAPPTRDEEAALLGVYRETGDRAVRDRLIDAHRGMAITAARRYCNRGEPFDDLVQVASMGLLNAIERFEPALGFRFVAFASRTIDGEIKRHFRDATWTVHVPRRVQELLLRVRSASSQLAQERRRQPTDADLASYLRVSKRAIEEARLASGSYSSLSIDRHLDQVGHGSWLADDEEGFARTDADDVFDWALKRLNERDRLILRLRFAEQRSQSEFAAAIGLSQMQVSRLLVQLTDRLRARIHHVAT
jgi:RNA polymerase sigma-B factor